MAILIKRSLQITMLVLFGLIATTVSISAETEAERQARVTAEAAALKSEDSGTRIDGDYLDKMLAQPSQSEAETLARQEFATAVFTYLAFAENHKADVFSWQMYSSKVIFWMVITIVFVGLYFSWLQFHAAKDPATMKSTTLKLGKAGVEVTSPVLGVVILVLSLAFLYLYLVHVYKITFV